MSDQAGTAREALRALLDEVFDDIEHVVNGNAGYVDRDMLDRYRSDASDYLALPHWTQRLGPVVACEHDAEPAADLRPREGEPGWHDVTCGKCGEEFGTNFTVEEIECAECEARRCPQCRAWFGGEQCDD